MLAGQVIFGAITYFLVQSGTFPPDPELGSLFIVIVPALLVGGYTGGTFLTKTFLRQAKDEKALRVKIQKYYTGMVVRYALVEGPVLFALVAYLITGNILLWGMGLAATALFLLLRPSAGKAADELELTDAERQELEKTA
mgnify:CR=1 FL=1